MLAAAVVAAGWVDRATVPAAQVRASASAAVGAWVALAGPVAGLGLGVVGLEDLVRAGAAVPAYGNLVVRPAVAEVAGRAVPAAVEAGALAVGQEPVGDLEPVEAEALVVGPGRVASLELVVAGALAVGQEPVAGLGPAVEAAQVGVAA